MALIAKPAAFTATTLTPAALNTLVDTIYDEFGTTTNGQGNITDANIAAAASIGRTKVGDVALVAGNTIGAGTQTVTRPTEFSGGSLRIDTSASNRSTDAVSSGATTVALSDADKAIQLLTFASGVTVNADLTTITGANVDQVYHFFCTNSDSAQTVTFTHNNSDVADSFKMKGKANVTCSASATRYFGTFLYGDLNGSGVNQLWEI